MASAFSSSPEATVSLLLPPSLSSFAEGEIK